jgi:hypothetical protein
MHLIIDEFRTFIGKQGNRFVIKNKEIEGRVIAELEQMN